MKLRRLFPVVAVLLLGAVTFTACGDEDGDPAIVSEQAIMNKQVDDYAWEVHPDGTMISYPSMNKTKTDIYVTVDGRKYAITPQGDTLYFKNR